jgi:hypothetical protein
VIFGSHRTAEALMNNGRWYPSAITLPNGGVLVLSGSFAAGPLQPPEPTPEPLPPIKHYERPRATGRRRR